MKNAHREHYNNILITAVVALLLPFYNLFEFIGLKSNRRLRRTEFCTLLKNAFCCLQRSIDEKYHCVEELEGQARRLQLALREKERDLERLRCILSSNEETITVFS